MESTSHYDGSTILREFTTARNIVQSLAILNVAEVLYESCQILRALTFHQHFAEHLRAFVSPLVIYDWV